jgi:peptide/nickel transport system permease protein
MRIVDVMLSIPSLLLAFSIAALFARPNQWTLIVAIATIQVPIFARMLRGSMLAQRVSDHVLAARALGVKPGAIVFRHMLPNALGPVIVQTTLVLAVAIIDAPDAGQVPGVHQLLPAPGDLPRGVHHRGRARLHADG